MMGYAVFVDGLEDLEVESLTPAIERAALRAVNATADRTRTGSADYIYSRLNFPKGYLAPAQKRLFVSKKAKQGDLEAIITGRHRATSLARFVTGGMAGRKGARVSIKRGSSVELPNAFLMKLRSGGGVETKDNLGLAIRTKRGATPDKAYKPVKISETLWLLYGPSVSQAFRYAADKEADEAAQYLRAEFSRLVGADL